MVWLQESEQSDWTLMFFSSTPDAITQMKSQMEARQKEVEYARGLQKAAEEKLQKDQESLLSCQKSCVEKSKTIRELQAQVLRE